MLVKKNVLNEINKKGAFTQSFNDCRKIKRKVSQNLNDLQNLLIKLTVKASSEKTLHMHERTIYHYIYKIQKTSSKQIQRKIGGTF